MEGEEASLEEMMKNGENPGQSNEEVLAIIQEARKVVAGDGVKIGESFLGGSMDLDELDDTDLDDIETSGDFVCAL